MLNLNLKSMAKITPIDVIKGISGKYGSGSSDYFATNKSSNQIHLAKYQNKPTGEPTASQRETIKKFTEQAKQASAWLRSNHPSAENGAKGTEAYQVAQTLKRQLHLSNVRQIVIKYMDEEGNVKFPTSPQPSPEGEGEQTGGGGSTNPTPNPSTGDDDNGGEEGPNL